MKRTSKALAIAVTLVAIGGTSLMAAAQGGPGYGAGWSPPCINGGFGYMQGRGGYGMMGGWAGYAYADPAAQLGSLKSALALRPDQITAWDAYAKAVQDGVKQMQALRGSIDPDRLRSMSWQEHWAYMGQFHDAQAAVFRSIRSARDGLLAVLDDAQKSRFSSSGAAYPAPGRGLYGHGPAMGPGYGGMGPGYGGGSGYGMMGGWGPNR